MDFHTRTPVLAISSRGFNNINTRKDN